MAVRLILPALIASFRIGATLENIHQPALGRSLKIGSTHSGGFAGSTMTASLDLSSTTKYA
jgi:hypothetical protein